MNRGMSLTLSLAMIGATAVPAFAVTSAHSAAQKAHLARAKANAAKSHAALMATLAPADEYFGPLKMSILGMNNAMVTVRRRQSMGEMTPDTEKSLTQVENSIHDWERKYPRDPWIARVLLNLDKTYALFPDRKAHAHAVASVAWMAKKYPRCAQIREARQVLAAAPAPSAGVPVANVQTAPVMPGAPSTAGFAMQNASATQAAPIGPAAAYPVDGQH